MTDPLLEVDGLHTHFHSQGRVVPAVSGISFSVAPGETLALVGESGCGKSVTALSIMRLLPQPAGRVVAGQIRFQGRNLLELNGEEMRRIRGKDISMVFQEPMTSLNPVLTVGRQLSETLEVHLDDGREAVRARTLEVMRQVGIPDPELRLKQYPHHLSGGMRQRVMIAMALACRPRLILADEPTTALDVTIQAQILALMKQLSREYGVAMILITHNLGVVARYADRVQVMYAGRIVESGEARQLYRRPRHPYTHGLLKSVPRLDAVRPEKLSSIEGQPPDPSSPLTGCPFRPRCTFATERCATEEPPLERVAAGHWSACWHHGRLADGE
ncbi:MAG: ABC transporter ATP-binding protein [SAR324 cluster bacterium]|nr:ABC transporter ATP-binding protein [SAR324 cluster bacterium]